MTRRVCALLGVLTVVGFAAPPAGAAPVLHVEKLLMATGAAAGAAARAAGTAQPAATAPGPCADAAHNELGGTWLNGSYSWAFNASSTPSYLGRAAVRDVLKRSFSNITSARNDCGLPDNVSATHTYLGTSDNRARCGRRDSHNVVGFRQLEWGILAVTCFWISNNRIVEADIQITTRESWALSLSSCFDQVMLEATITHEAGHVFGLDHVGERRHGRLTMSTYLDGPCQKNEATLGLGDVRGLEALY